MFDEQDEGPAVLLPSFPSISDVLQKVTCVFVTLISPSKYRGPLTLFQLNLCVRTMSPPSSSKKKSTHVLHQYVFLASGIHYHQYQCPPCLNHTCFDCSKIQETRQICSLLTGKMGANANFHHFRAKTCKAWLSCCPAASSRCHCSHPLLGPEIRYSGLRGAARCRKALSAGNTGCLLTLGRSCTLVRLSQLEQRRLLSYLNKKQRLGHLLL